jgi:hypothetical protein
VQGLEFDERTLALPDTDGHGRVRAPEVVAAIRWIGSVLRDPDEPTEGRDGVPRASIDDRARTASACSHRRNASCTASASPRPARPRPTSPGSTSARSRRSASPWAASPLPSAACRRSSSGSVSDAARHPRDLPLGLRAVDADRLDEAAATQPRPDPRRRRLGGERPRLLLALVVLGAVGFGLWWTGWLARWFPGHDRLVPPQAAAPAEPDKK